MPTAVLIVAAGRGARVGSASEPPKQYRRVAGSAVLARTVAAFVAEARIDTIQVVIHPGDRHLYDEALGPLQQSCRRSEERRVGKECRL